MAALTTMAIMATSAEMAAPTLTVAPSVAHTISAASTLFPRRRLLAAAVVAPFISAACKSGHVVTGQFTGASAERGHVLRGVRALPQSSSIQPSSTQPGNTRPTSIQPNNTQPSTTHRVHTLIAGGGVAGLSAARALRLQGIQDFALLELEDTAGGNARAGSIAGMAHPMGAHYLPVPGDNAPEVQDFLEELGLRQRISGRWQYDERHLCHSPQERLFFNGVWQDGLLPMQGVNAQTLAQYAQFAKLIDQWRATGYFQIPVKKQALAQSQYAQLATKFIAYLQQQGINDPHLLWYLDYCCRDDYGAGSDVVSTWAGIHYFAARHGFQWPGAQDAGPKDGVLTWPEGNGRLTKALAEPLADRIKTGRVVLRIEETSNGITADAFNTQTKAVERWLAERCVVALPLFIAARVVVNPPDFLKEAAQNTTYASWLVANVHINAPLLDAVGAAPAWDNVVYGQSGLGYVDAQHQSTRTAPGPSVLTYYSALGTSSQARSRLLEKSWAQHKDDTLAELALAHPDIYQRAVQVDICRYGHAMAVPTPDFFIKNSLLTNQDMRKQLLKKEQIKALKTLDYAPRLTPRSAKTRYAHCDWSGYSVFEEAFTRGLHAALA